MNFMDCILLVLITFFLIFFSIFWTISFTFLPVGDLLMAKCIHYLLY
uniref:Uncharacterized protein n=1 Tax=Rhizophora mucronata TaxID=61149 RepID=A0A2P2QT44_RHIMU